MPAAKETPVLVVDDDVGLLGSLRAILVSAGLPEPALLSDSRKAMDWVRARSFQLALLDLMMPPPDGMTILRDLKSEYPQIEVIILTAADDAASAVQAMKLGAYDYLVKPVQSEKLIITINNAFERFNLRHGLSLFERAQSFSDLKHPEAFGHMKAADEAMALVYHQAESAASTGYNLMITGESGTGKELLARTIHTLSDRSRKPFVAVNMAALSTNLFEDDLFGHSRGAFSGAGSERKGLFETAQGGTLLLDEITEMDTALQAKLLRVIQEKEFYPLGSTKSRSVDVRIIATSNRDLKKEIGEGHFRSDLFYRLNRLHIHIPTLKERKKDILPIAYGFLKVHSTNNGKKITALAPDLEACLLAYPFPGNVRELENIIASAVLREDGSILKLSSARHMLTSCSQVLETADRHPLSLFEVELRHIRHVLQLTEGNRTRAAKILGIGLRTLQRKLKVLGLDQGTTSL